MVFDRLQRAGAPPRIGSVHFGPGAFFRAFNAIYTDEAMAASGGDWGISAVSLQSPRARDQLAPQGGVYTAVTRAATGEETRVVGAIAEVLVAPDDPRAVINRLADPNVHLVTLTITEKGYCHDPATGRLNTGHPGVLHDLAHPEAPQTVLGFLVAGLRERRARGVAPFTVISCDNLPSNGALAGGVLIEFARLSDPGLADWVAGQVAFPATMVDRITPATTEEDIAGLAEATGYRDEGCVVHEPFRQWVIEDFAGARPDWHLTGAQFVADVAAHEHMKLRCLNGTHSALAYLGYLAGYETIGDTVEDADFKAFCEHLWQVEILPAVPVPEGEDLNIYTEALMARYQNPAIRHRTWQIAMDGSQKLPQRLLGSIRDRLRAGVVPEGLCLAVAAWMRYVGAVNETGDRIDVRDPLAERLEAASAAASTNAAKVAALLAMREVFGDDLPKSQGFVSAVENAYDALAKQGARATVAQFVRRA